jgi:hypothetical protein
MNYSLWLKTKFSSSLLIFISSYLAADEVQNFPFDDEAYIGEVTPDEQLPAEDCPQKTSLPLLLLWLKKRSKSYQSLQSLNAREVFWWKLK